MSDPFGIKFILVNDIRQTLPSTIFGGGRWIHLATIVRGFKEYCCLENEMTGKRYIEEVDNASSLLFKRIEDENEWNDLYQFLLSNGILYTGINKEFKIAK